MRLSVVSLAGAEFDGNAKSLTVPTTSGEITVLDNHQAFVTVLKEGAAIITDNSGVKNRIAVRGGFLEVDGKNHVTVLAD